MESLSPRNNPPAGSCTYRTSGWALPNPQKTLISYTSLACNHEVIKDHQDKKLVARFTVPVAPGSHQKIEASAHLIAEVRSSLCSPAHSLLPGSGRKPGARSTVPAPPLASCIDSPLLPRDCKNRKVANFLESSVFAFPLSDLILFFSLVTDIQNILNLILVFENAVRLVRHKQLQSIREKCQKTL